MPRFNTDIVLKVILQTHINNSLTKPITYHKFPMLKFDVASFINDNTADDLFKACYPRYKYSITRQWRKTTLDIDPGAFINIFLDSLESTETVLYWILEFGYVKVKKKQYCSPGMYCKMVRIIHQENPWKAERGRGCG